MMLSFYKTICYVCLAGPMSFLLMSCEPKQVQIDTERKRPVSTVSASEETDTTQVQDSISIDKTTIQFSFTHIPSQQTEVLTLTNSGSSDINELHVSLVNGKSGFQFAGGSYPGLNGNCSTTLAANQSCQVVLEFVSSANGSFSDQLSITTAQGVNLSVSLSASVADAFFDDLILYLNYNEAAPSDVKDLSSLKNTITVQGTPTYSNGAYVVDGDDSMRVAYAAVFDLTTQMTMATWFQANDLTATWTGLVSRYDGGGYAIWQGGPWVSWQNDFNCIIKDANTNNIMNAQFPKSDVVAGTWNHVACTFNGTELKIYLNGALKKTVSMASTTMAIAAAGDTFVGGEKQGNDPNYFFNGQLDETRLYSRALSDAEIAELYARGR